MTDFTKLTSLNKLVMNFKQQVIELKNGILPKSEVCIDENTFYKDNPLAKKSIFSMLDLNKDGYITEFEYSRVTFMDKNNDGNITKSELEEHKNFCMREALYFARRNIDKWFTVDVNRDGYWSNVEEEMAKYRMAENYDGKEHIMDASLSNDELSDKYLMKEKNTNMLFEKWINDWLEYIKNDVARNMYGVELNQNDMNILRAECIKQLNTWLFKTGDNASKDAPLYNSLNVTAYTRLVTSENAISCCGGDITPPPSSPNKDACTQVFRPLEFTQEQLAAAQREGKELDYGKLKNNSNELKNRLAWAAFMTPSKGKLNTNTENATVWSNFSDEEYEALHNQWEKLRNTTAAELRDMLNPLNYFKKKAFEANTIMSVEQMVQYIDIVESVTGKPWDSDGWEISSQEFYHICTLVNGTADDEARLNGKTRDDIPKNRQALLKFLEKKGWLYDQFKNSDLKEQDEAQNREIEDFWQTNDKNIITLNSDTNKGMRKVLSDKELNLIKEAKKKEIEQKYNLDDFEYILEINKFGDLHWAVRRK